MTRADELRELHKYEKIVEIYFGPGWKHMTAFGEIWCKETKQLQGQVRAANQETKAGP